MKTEKYLEKCQGLNIDQIAMSYNQWIWLDKLYKLMESFFFQFWNNYLSN